MRLLNATDATARSNLSFDTSSGCVQITVLAVKQRAYSHAQTEQGSVHLCSDEVTELLGQYVLLVRTPIVSLALHGAKESGNSEALRRAQATAESLFVVESAAIVDRQVRSMFELAMKRSIGFTVRLNEYRHFFLSIAGNIVQSSSLPLMSILDATTTVAEVLRDPIGLLTFGRALELGIEWSANHSIAASKASYGACSCLPVSLS